MYQEWVSYAGQHAFVHKEDHHTYARLAGWWCIDTVEVSLEDLVERDIPTVPRKTG